jgi:endonuclease/exonuclease/phosphatase family metal-dependent hydrolase
VRELCEHGYIDDHHATAALLAIDLGRRRVERAGSRQAPAARGRLDPQPAPQRPPARYRPDVRLRVVTYNIRSGTDLLGRPRLASQAAVIRAAAADLVLLQEVAGADQAETLARTAGLQHVVFGAARRVGAAAFGNALLCRWPLHAVTNQPVPGGRLRGQARAVLAATCFWDSQPVHAIGTHFGLLPGEAERAAHIVLAVASARRGPLIVGGDLNRPWAAAACHRRLGQTLLDCARADGRWPEPTFPAPHPVLRLDYLYVRGLLVREVAVVPSRAADHRPVLAELERRAV